MESIQTLLNKTRSDLEQRRNKADEENSKQLEQSKQRGEERLNESLSKIEEQRRRCMALLGK